MRKRHELALAEKEKYHLICFDGDVQFIVCFYS